MINRSIVPKGYNSVEDFLKQVDDTTIKEFGYDSVEEFKEVVGYVDEYLNASPKNNILNKSLAGGTHVKGVDYDVLGFPIFKGDAVKFQTRLDKGMFIASDDRQFKFCTKALKEAIEKGDIPKEIFTEKQLRDIYNEEARIKGLTWHHHQVPGKMQLVVSKTHKVNHLGGNALWGWNQMSKVQWRSPDEPIIREDVKNVEQELNINFPLDYIECVMKNNGAHVSPEVFEVEGKRKVLERY